MWRDTMRDLQWRRRRFVIAVIGTSLVFAVTLLIGGLADSFRGEARRTVEGLGIDGWVVKKDVAGPFTGVSLVDEGLATQLARTPGVKRAGPILVMIQSVRPSNEGAQTWGHKIGGVGAPPITEGRAAVKSGEAVVDDRLGSSVGEEFTVSSATFRIVGLTHGLTLFGGRPSLYLPIEDMQRLALNGLPLASAIGIQGKPASLPAGMHVVSPDRLRVDLLEPVRNAIGAIDFIRALLWVVAASIVGAVVYLSALERMRDFAVFKATGGSNGALAAGLAGQAAVVSVVAAALGTGVARLLVPVFPVAVEIPLKSLVLLIVVSLVIGAVASLFATRRASSVDPAIAFGGP